MTLSALIRKRDLERSAIATSAIAATQHRAEAACVANIAAIAVAGREKTNNEIIGTGGYPLLVDLLKATAGPLDPSEIAQEQFRDDRRKCSQCANLRRRVCMVARPGGLVSANLGYRPQTETLQRCAGYLPNLNDTDQRAGRERWPYLERVRISIRH